MMTRRIAFTLFLVILILCLAHSTYGNDQDLESVLEYDTMNVEDSYIPEQEQSAETLSFMEDIQRAFKGKIFKNKNPSQKPTASGSPTTSSPKAASSKISSKTTSKHSAVTSSHNNSTVVVKGNKKTKKVIYRKERSVKDTWNMLKPIFSLVGVGGASFHPFRNEIIYVSNEPGVLQIYRARFDRKLKKITSKPQRLVNTKNRCSAPRYLFDGSVLYLHDRGGNENFQIGYITNKDKHIWLTHNLKAKHLINTVTRHHMYFQSNSRNPKKFDVYRRPFPLDSPTSKDELIYTPDQGIARASLVSADESKIILSQHYSNVHSEILLLDLFDKTIVSLTKPITGDAHYRWQPVKFLNKAHTKLLVKTDYKSDFLRLAILHFPQGIQSTSTPPVFITIPAMDRIRHDVTGMTSNYKTKWSYLELNKFGYSSLIKIKLNEHHGFQKSFRVPIPLTKGVIAHGDARSFGHGMSVSRDGNMMAISMTNSIHPTNLYMLSLTSSSPKSTKKLKKTIPTAHYYPLLPQLNKHVTNGIHFIQETSHFFTSFDGTKIHYLSFRPDTPPPTNGYPLLVKLHGGPESQSRPTFNAITQLLVKSGFMVVFPNIRGSRGYGKTFLDADNIEKRLDAIHDIKMMAHHMSTKSFIDGKRLAVMGGSYGGYAAQMSVVTFPDMWKAGVSVVGMSNLETFFKHTAEWRRRLRYQEYGNYHTQLDLLRKISPVNHVDKIKCPLFIIQGENDERVPVSEARQMYEKLKQVGKQPGKDRVTQSVLMTFADEGHGLSKKANKEKAYKKLISWLKEIV